MNYVIKIVDTVKVWLIVCILNYRCPQQCRVNNPLVYTTYGLRRKIYEGCGWIKGFAMYNIQKLESPSIVEIKKLAIHEGFEEEWKEERVEIRRPSQR